MVVVARIGSGAVVVGVAMLTAGCLTGLGLPPPAGGGGEPGGGPLPSPQGGTGAARGGGGPGEDGAAAANGSDDGGTSVDGPQSVTFEPNRLSRWHAERATRLW